MGPKISQANVMESFRQVVLEHGEAAMAARLDIAVSTLSNKVQPYDHAERRHYLTLWEADSILSETGDTRPLEMLAARHGFVLLPMQVTPDAPTFEAESVQDIIEYGEYLAEKDPVKRVHLIGSYIRNFLETEEARRREESQ